MADAIAVGPGEGEGRQEGGFCNRDRRDAGWVIHDPQALQLHDEVVGSQGGVTEVGLTRAHHVAGGIAPMPWASRPR